MHALLALAIWLTSLPSGDCAPEMRPPPLPPRIATADEKVVSDQPAFWACDAALFGFAVTGGEAVTDRRYSVSPKWGNVLRAKVRFRNDARFAAPVVCWSKPGEEAQLFVDMSDPAG
jgi:hypothetical protein